MTVSYNSSYAQDGYDGVYHTLVGRQDTIHKEFYKWIDSKFTEEFKGTTKEIVELLNSEYPDDGNCCGGLNMRYRIEKTVTHDLIEGELVL